MKKGIQCSAMTFIFGWLYSFLFLIALHSYSFCDTSSLVEGCAFCSNGKIKKGSLTGKIESNFYHSKENVFSVAIPALSEYFIEDHALSPHLFGVAFYDHDGFLLKIQYDPLIEEVKALIRSYPKLQEELLDAIFYDMALPQLRESVPHLEVLHQKKIILENDTIALFAVLNLPKSATIINAKSGVAFDSKRGYLLFFSKGTHLVTFSLQDTISLMPNANAAFLFRLNERLLGNLLQIHTSFMVD